MANDLSHLIHLIDKAYISEWSNGFTRHSISGGVKRLVILIGKVQSNFEIL